MILRNYRRSYRYRNCQENYQKIIVIEKNYIAHPYQWVPNNHQFSILILTTWHGEAWEEQQEYEIQLGGSQIHLLRTPRSPDDNDDEDAADDGAAYDDVADVDGAADDYTDDDDATDGDAADDVAVDDDGADDAAADGADDDDADDDVADDADYQFSLRTSVTVTSLDSTRVTWLLTLHTIVRKADH